MTISVRNAQERRLLIVEDDADMRAVLLDEIAHLGYASEECHDGLAALERIRKGEIDAVLCDLRMPRMDGLALLRQVRSEGYQTPFVLLTGMQDVENASHAARLGAFDFLQKPYVRADLHVAVHRMLELGAKLR